MLFRRFSLFAFVLTALCSFPAVSRAIDARLLPADTEIVLTVNIKQILASDLVKSQGDLIKKLKALAEDKIPGGLPPTDEAMKYLEKLGLDPLNDLHSLTVAHPGSKNPEDVFFIVEGKFNPAKFEAAAKEAASNFGDNLKISKFGRQTIYQVSPGGDKSAFVALIGVKAIVVGHSIDAVKGAITRSTGTAVVATKVKELLKTTNNQQSVSVVFTGKALVSLGEMAQKAKGAKKLPPVGPFLDEVSGVSGAITISKDIGLELGVGFTKEAKAKEIAEIGAGGLDAVKPLVAQEAQKNADLAPLVDIMESLKISRNGSNVVLTGSVSNANLQKLFKTLGEKLK